MNFKTISGTKKMGIIVSEDFDSTFLLINLNHMAVSLKE